MLTALVGGLVLVGAFAVWQQRAAEPMLPLRFFHTRGFAAGNGAIFFTFASLFSCVFLFAQFLQTTLGYGPLETGLRLMPWTITFILIAPAAGSLADRIGERLLMTAGLTICAGGLTWLALIADGGAAYSQLLGPFIVAGIGVSMAIPSGQNAVVRGISLAEVGKAAGANSMMRELGGVFGIAVTVAVFAGLGGYTSARVFAEGFSAAVAVCAGFALLGAMIAAALPPGKPVAPPRSAEPQPALEGGR